MIQEVPYGSPLYELSKAFREEVLRRPLGLTLTPEEVEGEAQQIHIAAVEAGLILGTVVLKPSTATLVKLRQMAVAPSLHGTGVGRQLVQHAEAVALARGFETIEMNARASVKGFYEKLGYRSIGEDFLEVTIPHTKMKKLLRG